jgi:exodeoxyribonuclease-1
LIKQKQPKLFEYLFKLRNKREVSALLNLSEKTAVLHISGMFGAVRNNGAVVMPLAMHPSNSNGVICYDLSIDPTPLIELSTEQIRERVFTRADQLDGERIPLKTIHINKSPVIATVKMVDAIIAERIQVDLAACERHRQQLLAAKDLAGKLRDVFIGLEYKTVNDPEQMLYSGGFFSDADRGTMLQVRKADGSALAKQTFIFEDKRLPELLWRYRARNFPDTLSDDEREEWAQFCYRRLTDTEAGASIVLDAYQQQLVALTATTPLDEKRRELLAQLSQYADELLARYR